jgi:DNA-binding MarR family transcriptional regulator
VELDVDRFALAVEAFNEVFIRLPNLERLSFTTLSVLHTLSRTSPMRLTDLTATEQVTQSAITQLVTRLERDGLVERRPDPSDGRAVLVHLTPKGLGIVTARHNDRVARLIPLIDQLTPAERRALAAALPVLKRIGDLGR